MLYVVTGFSNRSLVPKPEEQKTSSPGKKEEGQKQEHPEQSAMGLFITWAKQALPGWLWLLGKGGIPARQAAEGSVLCLARQRPVAGTRASRCCETPRRHCIIQGMISGRMTNLDSRTPAGLVKTLGGGKGRVVPSGGRAHRFEQGEWMGCGAKPDDFLCQIRSSPEVSG